VDVVSTAESTAGTPDPDPRREELRASLDAVRRRIAAACGESGRDPGEVSLVVVTKFFPASDVRLLAELGVTDVAENRHQEAQAKAAECVDLGLRWHFVGGLQSNKAAAVASYADVVESVDRVKLVNGLARGAHERGHELDVLLQVSLDPPGSEHRSGVDPAGLDELAAVVADSGALRLRGLMAVAPLGEDPAVAFDRLAAVRDDFVGTRPDATVLSAGMSSDLEAAVARGATHVRVGSAVLGPRPTIK
jgi:pyridoxal phosphate enzyme (YggS family)